MSLADEIQRKVESLSEGEQRAVLQYVEDLKQAATKRARVRDPYGLLADQATNLTIDEFRTARQEVWEYLGTDASIAPD